LKFGISSRTGTLRDISWQQLSRRLQVPHTNQP
jgi:hypothetical protein